jgi:phosphate transport system permease protein
MTTETQALARAHLARRHRHERLFRLLCLGMCASALLLLAVLLLAIWSEGRHHLSLQFLTSFPSRKPAEAGIWPAIHGTVWTMILTAIVAVPLGVGAAVYLEEYAVKSRLNTFIEINIANLAGVPSIVYGMLGLALFARWLHLGRSTVAGALTLAILALPVIIIASREAIRAVPMSLRQASFAVGGTRWQTVRHHVLPNALPGILTGVILSLSRAVGETAPLVMLGAVSYISFVPVEQFTLNPAELWGGLSKGFTVLPIQIYNWASRPQQEFHELAASGIIVLMTILLSLNALAIGIRQRAEGRKHG